MALLLLTVVRGDLMRNWRASLPPDAPNTFLINVLPDQVDGVRALLERELSVDATLLPDGARPPRRGQRHAVRHHASFADVRARRLGEREFNLSWSETLPQGNRVVAGHWWKPGETGGASLEEGIAETLGIKLGDTLTYDIAGTQVTAKVHEPAQGRLGQLPRQLLRAVRAGRARVAAADLHRRLPRRGRGSAPGSRRWCANSRTCSRSTSARCCGRCSRSWTRSRARSSSCSCSRSRAACSCSRRRSPRRRTSGGSTRRSCARWARRRAALRGAGRGVPRAGRARRPARGGRRDRSRLRARRSRVPDPVPLESAPVGRRHRRRVPPA